MFRLLVITTLLCGSVIGQQSNESDVVFTASARDSKVINGVSTDIQLVPYQISLHRRNFQNVYDLVCGGSIISEFWVLTAGHCFENNVKLDLYISLAGATIIGNSVTSSKHFLSSIHIHESYYNSPTEGPANDVALIKVQTPFIFDKYRQPISLPPKNYVVPAYTAALVTGWGSIDSKNYQPSAVLQSAFVTVISKDVCVRDWYNFDTNGKLCVASYLNRKGTCEGDSGGPLVANHYLIGITSWGSEPCLALPNVYTEVAYYRDWINQISGV